MEPERRDISRTLNENFFLHPASLSPATLGSDGFRKLNNLWHPHVYANPPKRLTPFSIDDILQVQEQRQQQRQQQQQQQQLQFQLQQKNLLDGISLLSGAGLGMVKIIVSSNKLYLKVYK